MPISFTELTIKKLPEGLHFDARLPSFGIRVGKNRKTWLVIKGDNRTKVRLGHYPSLSLAEARKRALVALGSPFEPPTAPSFPDALDTFLAQDRWRPYSKYVLENSLRNHFYFKRPVDKISHEDIADALDAIQAPSTRAHALKDIKTFFNWCIPRYVKFNPSIGIKVAGYKKRKRTLTDDELKRVWLALPQSPEPFATIVKSLILTGARKNEIAHLRWNYVQTDRILLPGALTKNGRDHAFPLGDFLRSVIPSSPPKKGDTYMFPGTTGKPYNGWGKHIKELRKNSRTADWTVHDLRRTFATGLASLGTPIHITERLLNHVSGSQGGIVDVYQTYDYWPERVAAIHTWENRVKSLCSTG